MRFVRFCRHSRKQGVRSESIKVEATGDIGQTVCENFHRAFFADRHTEVYQWHPLSHDIGATCLIIPERFAEIPKGIVSVQTIVTASSCVSGNFIQPG